jgi:hypothetical protein
MNIVTTEKEGCEYEWEGGPVESLDRRGAVISSTKTPPFIEGEASFRNMQ